MATIVIVLLFIMVKEQMGKQIYKISVILQDSDSSQWSALRYGIRMAAKDRGAEVFFTSVGDELTVHEQINTIKYEIDNGANAVIVHPVSSADTEAELKKLEKKVPVMLVGSTASKDRNASILPTTEADNYAMGRVLAEEILKDYNGNVQGKRLGIITSDSSSEAITNRIRGFKDILENTGAKICWTISSSSEKSGKNSLKSRSRVDLVIALDNASLVNAGEHSALNNLHGALVYGIGHSTEAVYYLDTGDVECLVVPDEFNIGYKSLTEVVESLEYYFHKMKNRTLYYTILRKEELFSEKNQEIIFTMSQM